MALSIEGPSKVDIQTEDMEDGTCGVAYCPTEPGTYVVSVRFAEEHVPGKFKHINGAVSALSHPAYTLAKRWSFFSISYVFILLSSQGVVLGPLYFFVPTGVCSFCSNYRRIKSTNAASVSFLR